MAARRPTSIQLDRLTAAYELGDYVASGGCGTVMMCTRRGDPEGKKYILKYMNLDELTFNKANGAQREAQLMKDLNHPNIVTLYDVFECDNKLHLVMEYCDKGDLRDRISEKKMKRRLFNYSLIRRWMLQLTKGIKALHDEGIVHRDIKPENIFLTGHTDDIRIGDLGISRRIDKDQRAKTRIGTPRYVSPEVMKGIPYSFETDIWALGVMMIEMCTLQKVTVKPTKKTKRFLCFTSEVTVVDIPEIPKQYGTKLMSIAKSMLKEDPSDRITASQLLHDLTNLPLTPDE